MGIQLRKPLFCLFQYLPERNIWFIHCLLGGKLSPKVTDEGATGLPNGAEEKFRWGDRWEPPFSTPTRKGWVQGRPLIRPSVRTGAPSPRGEGFGGGCFPLGYPPSHRFTRQGTPRRVSPPAGGERKSNHVLTGFAGQNILLTPRVPAPPARFGVHPPILGAQRSGSQNSCLSQPAQLGGGPLRALENGPQARQDKKRPPPV